MKTYSFEAKLLATVSIEARNAEEAHDRLFSILECCDCNTRSDSPVLFEAGLDGDLDLVEETDTPNIEPPYWDHGQPEEWAKRLVYITENDAKAIAQFSAAQSQYWSSDNWNFAQYGEQLDFYLLPGKNEISLGIRYGSRASDYISPVADQCLAAAVLKRNKPDPVVTMTYDGSSDYVKTDANTTKTTYGWAFYNESDDLNDHRVALVRSLMPGGLLDDWAQAQGVTAGQILDAFNELSKTLHTDAKPGWWWHMYTICVTHRSEM